MIATSLEPPGIVLVQILLTPHKLLVATVNTFLVGNDEGVLEENEDYLTLDFDDYLSPALGDEGCPMSDNKVLQSGS